MKLNKFSVFPKNIKTPNYYSNKQFIFIDISGFTPLCDEFIKSSKYGAEKIGDLLNNIFSPIIDVIYENQGDVISFAGDALFASINKKDYNKIKRSIEKSVRNYSKKMKKYLSVKIEIFDGIFYPYIIEGKNKKHFIYFNKLQKSRIKFKEYDVFPKEIFSIAGSEFKGELRSIPIFFLHINRKFSLEKIKKILKNIIDLAPQYNIYINKIEFLDKGWMILLSSGLPIYSINSQYKIFDYLNKIVSRAKKEKIELKIGGTLRRGYAGIIGNNNRWEYTFIGSNVNLAARIAVKAEPFKIFTDYEFAKTIKEKVEISFIKSYEYKGIESKTDIYEIKKYKKNIEKTIFVGRKKEINQSLEFLNNSGKTLIVWGSSGIGKTEFVKQILNQSGKNHILMKGIHGNQTPFYMFEEYLSYFKKSNLKTSKREIIQKLFRNIKEPTIIFIDDVSYADPYSVEMIKWILSEGNEYVNIIITAFTEEEVNAILPPVKVYDIRKLSLSSLLINDIQELFYEYTHKKINKKIARNIVKITGGNPLFLVYLIKFMGEEIIKNPDTPYSLKELILLRVNELPHKGEDFVEGGAVFGDIFNALIVADAVKFNKDKLESILEYANHYGMLHKLNDSYTIVFSNAIIRETIYETLLEKQINYIRIKLAEIIVESNKYIGSKKIAAQLFYLANDKRCLNVFEDLLNNEDTKDFEYQRSFLIKFINFVIKNKMYTYDSVLNIIEKALVFPMFYFNSELANILFDIAIKIENWKNQERFILQIAQLMSSFLMDNKKANILLNKYKKIKGKDPYYKWNFNVINKYSADSQFVIKTYKEIEDFFEGKDRINFYLNYLAYAFFIIGDEKIEKYVLNKLKKLQYLMDGESKAEYYQLLNSLHMHRDEIEESIKYLDKLKRMNLDNKYYRFLTYNDLAIIYNQIGIKKLDNKILRKSMLYMIKAYKFVKDAGMKTQMPLITTNLGTSYSSEANIKKTIKYYYEGYLYGKDINHPVEVPYTMSRISRLSYTYGTKKLSIELSKEIIKKHSKVGDLLPVAYTTLYINSGNIKYYKKGLEIAETLLSHGIGKCIGEITSTLFWGGIIENNEELLKKSHALMIKYKNKIHRRSIQKFVDDIMFEILEIKLKNKNTNILKKQLEYINQINKLKTLKTIINYFLSQKAKTMRDKKKYFNEAYLLAKKIKLYSVYDLFFEYNRVEELNIISPRSETILKRQKEKFEKVSTIEEFYKFFNK